MPFYERKATRIPKYDYSSNNYYFITICTDNKKCIFGKPDALSIYGKIADQHVAQIQKHYQTVRVDKYVVMPNHVHLILILDNGWLEKGKADVRQVIGQYKAGVTREIRTLVPDADVWQRSFHDHIIRNQADYERIWLYIEANPQRWEKDCFYAELENAPYDQGGSRPSPTTEEQ